MHLLLLFCLLSSPLCFISSFSFLQSFWNAYKAFDKGNLIGGINQLAQGIIGLLPGLTPPMKAAIFGGMDVLAALLENQFGKELLPKGAGANFMAAILKSTSAVFKMFGNRPDQIRRSCHACLS